MKNLFFGDSSSSPIFPQLFLISARSAIFISNLKQKTSAFFWLNLHVYQRRDNSASEVLRCDYFPLGVYSIKGWMWRTNFLEFRKEAGIWECTDNGEVELSNIQ